MPIVLESKDADRSVRQILKSWAETEEEREAIKEFINKTTEEQDMTASEIDHAVACFIDGWVAHERRSVK